VDLLEEASGRLYMLEVNYPCYFAHAQFVAKVDIAGRMVAHLAAKAAADRAVPHAGAPRGGAGAAV
jgi:hypothetical protein